MQQYLKRGPFRRMWVCMKARVFTIDDRTRLPWRFFGAMHTVLASL
jgi:lysozyme family protein